MSRATSLGCCCILAKVGGGAPDQRADKTASTWTSLSVKEHQRREEPTISLVQCMALFLRRLDPEV